MLNEKRAGAVIGVGLFLLFCIFILVHQKRIYTQARMGIASHARIIKNAVWNYNPEGAEEYLQLAARTHDYESLRVIQSDGLIFNETRNEIRSGLENLLIRIHLIPRVRLSAPIVYQDIPIGKVEAVWLPHAVYLYAYVFLALSLLYTIIHLNLQLLKTKAELEQRVAERTAELLESNQSLQQEIEERIRVENALRSSEEKHRLLAENINDVIWTMDLDFQLSYISPASTKMHGWTEEELPRTTIEDFLPPPSMKIAGESLFKFLQQWDAKRDSQASITLELEQYRKDKSMFWTEVTASFMLDDNQRPVGVLGVTRDITERKQAEKERERLQQRLERSRKMEGLGLLAGGVAHDLNNVLSGIVSYPDLLLMDLPQNSPLRAPILTIKESGQKAATIVQDLLTLARRGVVTRDILNLNDVIDQYRTSPEHDKIMSYHPEVQVSFELETGLPNIQGSSVHLKKTIMNLVSNAAEAQAHGGQILVSTRSVYLDRPIRGYDKIIEGEYVVLIVQDQGEGIGSKDLNHIFEPFYTKKIMGRSGTGLGLAVVWGTLQDHRGYINVNSTVGRGTQFELYFPLSREAVTSKEASYKYEEVLGNGETILVVDDVRHQRDIAARLLERLNYRPATAESGEAALVYMRKQPADLVILDMIMDPGIDGLETYLNILEINPSQKAIIASGYAETDRVKEALRRGVCAYLKKPYLIDKLGETIRKALAT